MVEIVRELGKNRVTVIDASRAKQEPGQDCLLIITINDC